MNRTDSPFSAPPRQPRSHSCALQPASLRAALLLGVRLLTPRAMSMAWLLITRRSRAHASAAVIVTTLVVAAALSRLVDAIFVHPDAQVPPRS